MSEFRCSTVLFDLDGVLVDSSAVLERHWREWAELRGVEYAKLLEIVHGRRTEDIVRTLAPHIDAAAEATRLATVEGRDTRGLAVVRGASALVGALPADAWAVVTSGTRVTAETRLRHVGLPLPSVLVTADDVSRGKPDPEGYLAAAQRLRASPSECVVIEDAPAGVAAARAAGMRAIGVAFQHTPEQLGEADGVIAELADLHVEITTGRRSVVLRATS